MNPDNLILLAAVRESKALKSLNRLTGLQWESYPESLLVKNGADGEPLPCPKTACIYRLRTNERRGAKRPGAGHMAEKSRYGHKV